jgi:hypothetical protein
VLAAPAVSCANVCEESAHEHTGTVGAVRHSLRDGLTAYAVLSLETNSFCLHRCRLDGWSIRLDRCRHRQLGTSHGCRDHTVLPYASAPSILRAVARSRKSPCEQLARRHCRVHHIPPRVRDDRDTPLLSSRDSREKPLIWGQNKAEYICRANWTAQIRLKLF